MPHVHEPKDRNVGQWIEANDRIYVAAYSSVSSLSITFSGYFRKMNGEVIQFNETVNPTSDRAVTSKTVTVGAGFLISLVAYISSGNANRGQCYVRARVQRSTGTPQVILANLIGGYVTDEYQPSFPYGKIEGSLEGPGNIRTETVADPSTNAGVSIVVPTGSRAALVFGTCILTASADAANRLPYFAYDSGTSITVPYYSSTYVTANGIRQVSASPNGAHIIHTTFQAEMLPVARQAFPAGWTFSFLADNIHANDRFSGAEFAVEEWIEA